MAPMAAEKRKKLSRIAYAAGIGLCAGAVLFFSLSSSKTSEEPTVCTVIDGDTFRTVEMKKYSARAVLDKFGYGDGGYTYTESTDGDGVTLLITRPRVVQVQYDGSTSFLSLYDGTVADALAALDITLSPSDSVSQPLDAEVSDGMCITVTRIKVAYSAVEYETEFETTFIANDSMYEGTSAVVTEGATGTEVTVYKSVTVDGTLESFSKVSRTTAVAPTTQVIEYGTKVKEQPKPAAAPSKSPASSGTSSSSGGKSGSGSSGSSSSSGGSSSKGSSSGSSSSGGSSSGSSGTGKSSYASGSSSEVSQNDTGGVITTSSGKTYSYSKVVNLTATAYSYDYQRPAYNTTASGVPVQVGVVACNPSTLPMGTKVYIVSAYGSWEYGYAVVGDTGCRAGIIDLFMESEDECNVFGVRDALVYILD